MDLYSAQVIVLMERSMLVVLRMVCPFSLHCRRYRADGRYDPFMADEPGKELWVMADWRVGYEQSKRDSRGRTLFDIWTCVFDYGLCLVEQRHQRGRLGCI